MRADEALIIERRVRWSRERFERFVDLGAFEARQVELVRGEVVDRSAHSVSHANILEFLNELLIPALVGRARVRMQLPFIVDDETELIPDFAIVDRKTPKTAHPSSALLIIEVSDSSSRYDRLVKAPLYAQACVAEYWLVDKQKGVVEVFTSLRGKHYTKHTRHSKGALAVPGFSDVQVPLDALFD